MLQDFQAFLQLAYAKESMLAFHNDLLHYSYKNLAGQNDQIVFLSENSNILREINQNYLSYPLQNQNHSSCCPFSKIPNSNFPKTFSPENNQVESYNENQQLFSHQNNLNQINQNNYTNSSNPLSDVFDESDLKVEEPIQEKQEPVIEDIKEVIVETKLENDIKEEIESSPSFSNGESVKEMSSEIKEEQLFSPKQEEVQKGITDLENDLLSFLPENIDQTDSYKIIGLYSVEERQEKILKYKNKIRKWRENNPVSKKFNGRSSIANKKFRVKGKFVTEDIYLTYVKYEKLE